MDPFRFGSPRTALTLLCQILIAALALPPWSRESCFL